MHRKVIMFSIIARIAVAVVSDLAGLCFVVNVKTSLASRKWKCEKSDTRKSYTCIKVSEMASSWQSLCLINDFGMSSLSTLFLLLDRNRSATFF
jgi:hypothetical protein